LFFSSYPVYKFNSYLETQEVENLPKIDKKIARSKIFLERGVWLWPIGIFMMISGIVLFFYHL